MTVKCGQCIGCRLDHSREWAIRCVHEAKYHDSNSFITLTFAKEPEKGSLSKHYFQQFMKRLRKKLDTPVRFYMCGEYGNVYNSNGDIRPGLLGRPHFHAIIFGYDFPDREYFKKSATGFPIYNSKLLSDTWGEGFATTQNFTVEAAAYVARYVTKKITGDQAERHYQKVDEKTGEIYQVLPEYTNMSLRPGIGGQWLKDFSSDLYPKDFVTNEGIKFRAPRYYDKLFEVINPDQMEEIKEKRREHARRNKQTPERLAAMETCKHVQAERLKRDLNAT
jgi:hypothetical protein